LIRKTGRRLSAFFAISTALDFEPSVQEVLTEWLAREIIGNLPGLPETPYRGVILTGPAEVGNTSVSAALASAIIARTEQSKSAAVSFVTLVSHSPDVTTNYVETAASAVRRAQRGIPFLRIGSASLSGGQNAADMS